MPAPFDHSSYTERAAMPIHSIASRDQRRVPVLVRRVHVDLPFCRPACSDENAPSGQPVTHPVQGLGAAPTLTALASWWLSAA
jgi:hypothetical protein